MVKITVSDSDYNQDNLNYVQSSMSEFFTYAGCRARMDNVDGRAVLTVTASECYADVVRAEISDKVSEIIAIKYKYDYFKKNVLVSGLKSEEKEILITSLIAADLLDDKKFSFDRVKGDTEIAVDGVYNFRLKALKKKWGDVASYIPPCFLSSQLKDFITYLLENKKKRVYVDCGRVYDWHFRRLTRSSLIGGGETEIVKEVILSGGGEVEIKGEIPKNDEFYLKEFYSDKIFFSNSVQ